MSKKIKTRKGAVISDKMDKTAVVTVETLTRDTKYQKTYKSTKKFKVHDPENKCKVGDIVEFVECRPISRDKKYKMVQAG